ncbi:DUF3127 domain-containing protein [Candidatus Karelsulcia muelleri]|uniref:DUF3127 domain-containing protein n=1 Tax=Candidatus Karelsulcia muelleri TaxID=336810 RepID=UPI000D7C1192|nr:DUF3127 domain-containing protein [Candidatus Karelsulcia muelleri]
MEILGILKKIFDIKHFKNGFKKREILVLTEEQYPQNLLIEFLQSKVKLIENFSIEDRIKIFINLKGREWITPTGEKKYFNYIQGWKIEKPVKKIKNSSSTNSAIDEFDELPF